MQIDTRINREWLVKDIKEEFEQILLWNVIKTRKTDFSFIVYFGVFFYEPPTFKI